VTRNFRDPRRRAAYQVARANHASYYHVGTALRNEYRRGYDGLPSHADRSSIAHAYWAAGFDNRRTHERRRRVIR
jgi:hypothetical protein